MPATNIIGITIAAFIVLAGALLARALGYAIPQAELISCGMLLGGAIGHIIDLKWPEVNKNGK